MPSFPNMAVGLLMAHTTIVFTRYLLLGCQQPQAIDERTIDGVFRACVQELKALTLADAINRLIAFVSEWRAHFANISWVVSF